MMNATQRRRHTLRRLVALVATACVAAHSGCSGSGRGASPYTAGSAASATRDPQRAQALHARAGRLGPGKDDEAERLLREALAADLYHGPAHNNLGVLLLRQGRLYEAAHEFEWARKLMPGHPDPRVNLAIALEHAGRTDDALRAYDAALAVYDNYLPALQGRARLLVASGRADRSAVPALREIAMRGDDEWREWASLQMIRLRNDDPGGAGAGEP